MKDTSVNLLEHKLVADRSSGQRQRAWIAVVLAQQTNFILLHEPRVLVRYCYQLGILELAHRIVARRRIVIFVFHDIN